VLAVPIVFKLHDGIAAVVAKMTALCVTYMGAGSYVLLDAYYASPMFCT
jgi:hypothetical protein